MLRIVAALLAVLVLLAVGFLLGQLSPPLEENAARLRAAWQVLAA